MAARGLLLPLLATTLVVGAHASCGNVSALSTGLDTLLAEYAVGVAPAAPVRVRAALDVRHAAVDAQAGTVRLLADLRLSWEDPRLSWNATEWDCDTTLVPAERLWLPDVELLNGAAGAGAAAGSLRARLSSRSEVLWITRLDVAVPLAIDLRDWPSDKQETVFMFGSREHTADEIDLELDDFKYATVWEAGTWEIEAVSGQKATLGSGDALRGVVTWRVRLRRRAAAHAMSAAAVLAAAALVLLAAVLLPPVQRPALCACAAFTAALWLTSVVLRLPGSATSPRSLVSLAGVCGAAGACCACVALLARLARCTRPPPPLLRTLLTAAPAWSVAAEPTQEGSEASAPWAAAAQLLDTALRMILALVLLVLLCIAL